MYRACRCHLLYITERFEALRPRGCNSDRVAMVREKYLKNKIFSRSGKSQGILWIAREI